MDIIDLLVKQGLITAEQLNKAKEETRRTGIKLEKALEKFGFINEEDIVKVKADSLGVLYMDLSDYIIDTELVKIFPEALAKKYKVVPIFKIADTLNVAMVDPQNIEVIDNIRKATKIENIDTVLVSEKGIQKVLDSYYGVAGSVAEIVSFMDKEKNLSAKSSLSEAAEDPPIIKLVNILIMEAVKDKASDIHIEPDTEFLRIRYRIDGILHEAHQIPAKFQKAIISRVKVISNIDISENRRPQDGKIHLRLENKEIDIRVSTFPTVHGENIVMRILDKTSVLLGLKDLGFDQANLSVFDKLIRQPNGIILVTGPTGSGKTTTLYSALATISSIEKNIITIEDPVEYEIPLIRQTQVNTKAELTFANGLRSILRQDPDVIMVGEIRDKETAEVAIQASLTGHLVFSTLNTNDAPSSLTRLIDMGIEQFLISSSVIGILAQRLVRAICDKCKEKYTPDPSLLHEFGITKPMDFYRGKGCPKCKNSGFTGRIGIFELLVITEDIRKLINEKASADQIKKKAIQLGLKTLRDDGLDKVDKGLTTIEEVVMVTAVEE